MFYGNPNVAISAIDTSGGIVCSRTSGQTPCFIQVSASAITATGTSLPYEDLEYSWDFGDPSGTETFTRPTDGAAVNANSDQIGPEAAYVYRSAGTYTVTLTIRGVNGGAITTATVTQTITVTAYNASGGTYQFDSAAGHTISDINAVLSTGNRLIQLKRGSVWSGATGLTINASPMRIEAYGTGADPIIEVTSGSASTIYIRNGGSSSPNSKDDIVASNVEFASSGGTTGRPCEIATSNATATLSNIYFDRCDFRKDVDAGVETVSWPGEGTLTSNFGIWGGSITSVSPATLNRQGIYGGAHSWTFFVGFSIEGWRVNSTLDHHIYPQVYTHGLYRWIAFGDAGDGNYCINTNLQPVGASGLEYGDYHLISENEMTGTHRAVDASNASNDPSTSRFRNFVIERNTMHGLTGTGAIKFYCAETMTVRDNIVWGCEGYWFNPETTIAGILSARVYRNKIYQPSGSSGPVIAPQGTITVAQTYTDNRIHDARTSAQAMGLVVADHVAAGSAIDRNQYYAPNDTDGAYLLDGATAKTFSQWQAAGFDTMGLVRDPEWADPANGDFASPRPIRLRLV